MRGLRQGTRREAHRRSVCGWIVLSSLSIAPSAQAFCRTTSCELGEEKKPEPCPRDAHQCVTQGAALHWPSACLDYAVQLDGSARAGVEADQVQALVAGAFATWQAARCPGGGTPRFQARFQGYVSCDRAQSVCGGADKNVNVVMFHDQDWPHSRAALGVTTPTGGVKSGLLNDADVELNSRDFSFMSSASDPDASALRYTLTHELGHFLGLSHSDADGALMSLGYQSLPLGAELLSADDVAAICTVYPPGKPLACPAANAPAYDSCPVLERPISECQLATVTHDESTGCGCRAAPSGSRPSALAALGVLLAALGSRRRAARRVK